MPAITPADKIHTRKVSYNTKLIQEHLEAMQRDAHGMEYEPWKREVDDLWKRTFESINRMSPEPQRNSLESIREIWTTYITHYNVIAGH